MASLMQSSDGVSLFDLALIKCVEIETHLLSLPYLLIASFSTENLR